MKDKDHLLLTAIGPDRVGLVERISQFIASRNCNIEDSKMAVFCGEFAVIVLISGAAPDLLAIAKDYKELEAETGLGCSVKKPAAREFGEPLLPYRLSASAMDHPGIVHRLSRAMSALGVNIESMETRTYAAPESGTPIFRLEALISIPARTSIHSLRERFSQIQREENIDIELSPRQT